MSKKSEYKKADLIWDIKYFISSFWLGFPKEIVLNLKSLWQPKILPEKKFVIFSTGRTGSTLLTSLLNSNTDIFCDGEILKHRYFFPFKVLDLFSKKANKKIYGFKLLTHHIKDVQWAGKRDSRTFLQRLVDDGYKIIYLERRHRLNQCLSMMYAILRNDWHKKKGNGDRKSKKAMEVDLQALDWWLNGFDELNAFEKKTLKGIPHVHVVYEDDLANPEQHQETVDRICKLLEIPRITAKTNLRKITPMKYDQFITNASEMITHLSGTKYATYLKGQIQVPESEEV